MRTSLAICSVAAALSPVAVGVHATASVPVEPLQPEAIAAAAEQTATSPLRFDLRLDAAVPELTISGDTPIATGEVADTSAHIEFDLDDMLSQAGAPGNIDGTIEVISSEDGLYFRSPLIAMFAQMMPSAPEQENPLEAFTELGDGWGYVEYAALTEAADVDQSAMQATMNPAELLDLISEATKFTDLGTETIHGVETTGVRASVNLGRLAEFAAEVDSSMVPPADLEALGDVTLPVDVWVGSDGYIHRIAVTIDTETFQDAADAADDLGADQMGDLEDLGIDEFTMSITLDLFDFGSDDIDITPPTEFVDVTDSVLELAELAEAVEPVEDADDFGPVVATEPAG